MNINEEISNILEIAGNNEPIPVNVWESSVKEKLEELFPDMIIKCYNDGEMLINGHKNTYSIKIKDYYWHNQQKFMMVNIEGVKIRYKSLDILLDHLKKDVEYFFVTIGEYNSMNELK